jgi:hypothetical protein
VGQRKRIAFFANREGGNKIRVSGSTVSLFVAGLLALVCAPAALAAPKAVQTFAYSHSFASEGQLSLTNTFNNILVETGSGNVLVAGEGSVQVFGPESGPADPPLAEFAVGIPFQIAQDPIHGWIYVQSSLGAITRWKSDGAPVPTYVKDPTFEIPGNVSGNTDKTIAVDPRNGDVLTEVNGAGPVVRYSPSGQELSSFAVGRPTGLVVGPDGTVYVSEVVSLALTKVTAFSPSGTRLWVSEFDQAEPRLAANPRTGNLLVLSETTFFNGKFDLREYDSEGRVRFIVPMSFPGAAPLAPMTFAVGEDGNLYLPVFSGAKEVAVFGPAIYPGVEAPKVVAIGTESVRLSGEVDQGEETPGGGLPSGSFARFEYSSDEGETWTPAADLSVGSGGGIEATISGLQSNFTYEFRVVAGNDGATHFSAAITATTVGIAPVVSTGGATEVSPTTASVEGTIETIGSQTGYVFEYGTSILYGSRAPIDREALAGNARAPRSFSQELTGLAPGTTYHYRIVATNAFGRALGEDRTFTTPVEGAEAARVYEQVTPTEKGSGQVDAARGFLLSPSGEGMGFVMFNGAGARGAPLEMRYATKRGPSGWGPALPTDPPINVPRVTVIATTLGISPDFSHALVVSNKKLTPDALENETDLYVENIETGTFKLVATSEAPRAFDNFVALQSADEFIGGNADYSKVVFESKVPMTGAAGVTGAAIYSWSEAEGLKVLSTLPDGSIAPATLVYGDVHELVRRTSEDLSRLYFALIEGEGEGVYLNESGAVRAISTPEVSGGPSTPQPGRILGVSQDGRYAFFLVSSQVPLTEDAPAIADNVYRYDAVTGRVLYLGGQTQNELRGQALGISNDGDTIYYLTAKGVAVWSGGSSQIVPNPGTLDPAAELSYVSPNGRYLEFEDGEEFIEGENRPPLTIYLYDHASGQTVCISCRPNGSNPRGAALPDTENVINATRPSPVGDDGEALFTTTAQLVPGDVNGVDDVYSYRDGVVRLISPGDAPYPAIFAARSEDGRDIYFTTAQGLVPGDTDFSNDIYDARSGGVAAAPSSEATACVGESCAGPAAAAPASAAPASEAVSPAAQKQPAKHKQKQYKQHKKHKQQKKHKKKAKHKKKKSAGHQHGAKANHKDNGGNR